MLADHHPAGALDRAGELPEHGGQRVPPTSRCPTRSGGTSRPTASRPVLRSRSRSSRSAPRSERRSSSTRSCRKSAPRRPLRDSRGAGAVRAAPAPSRASEQHVRDPDRAQLERGRRLRSASSASPEFQGSACLFPRWFPVVSVVKYTLGTAMATRRPTPQRSLKPGEIRNSRYRQSPRSSWSSDRRRGSERAHGESSRS